MIWLVESRRSSSSEEWHLSHIWRCQWIKWKGIKCFERKTVFGSQLDEMALYLKLCWCIKVLKTFQIKPGTYSSAESWEYVRAKRLLLMPQSQKTLRVAVINLDLAKWDICSLMQLQLHVGMQIMVQNQLRKTSRSVCMRKKRYRKH